MADNKDATQVVVSTQIPHKLIEDVVRAQIVESLKGDGVAMIDAVVREAMNRKKDTYSSTPTYFQEEVEKMIREEAREIFKEWLDSNRDNIKSALFKHLNSNKQKRLLEFCEKLAGNITTYGIDVRINLSDK